MPRRAGRGDEGESLGQRAGSRGLRGLGSLHGGTAHLHPPRLRARGHSGEGPVEEGRAGKEAAWGQALQASSPAAGVGAGLLFPGPPCFLL